MINYVIATYNGYTKRKYTIPSTEDTLKIHIEKIKKYKSIINQITIMKAKSRNYYKNYYNCCNNLNEIDGIPIKIIDCDNYGYSMGQWLKAYELSKNKFEYYIFIEDDYCPNMINFDQILLNIYNKKFNSNIGLLCSVVEGKANFNLRNKSHPLHFEGVIMISKKTLQKLYERWENNALLWLNKINSKIEPNYNWSKIRKAGIGYYYQIAFSHMFTLSGIKHVHYLNEYYDDKLLQFSVWHDHAKYINFYTNSQTVRKTFTMKDINNSLIIPIQLYNNKSIECNTHLKLKPKIVFIIGMHRCGTSLLANCLVENGFSIGKSLNKDKNWQNPRGYFENDKFTQFHNNLLKYNNSTWCNITEDIIKYTGDMVKNYRKLINQEFNNEKLILIKDPRLTFFTEFLKQVCEKHYDIYFLFLTRDKNECVRSLQKAQGITNQKATKLYDLTHNNYKKDYMKIIHRDIIFNNNEVIKNISQYCEFKQKNIKNLVDMSLYRNRNNKSKIIK